MVTFRTSRGSGTVELTNEEAREVFDRAQSALEKGQTNVTADDPRIRKAANFLIKTTQARAFTSGMDRFSILSGKARRDVIQAGRGMPEPKPSSTPTRTEQQLRMSLTPELRDMPVRDVREIQKGKLTPSVSIIEEQPQFLSTTPSSIIDGQFDESPIWGKVMDSREKVLGVGSSFFTSFQGFREDFQRMAEERRTRKTKGEFIREKTGEILETQFESLTPEQLSGLAALPGSGVSFSSTSEGDVFVFTPTEKQVELAGARATKEFRKLPKDEQQKLIVKDIKVGAKKGLIELGAGLIGLSVPRFEYVGGPTFEEATTEMFQFTRDIKEEPIGTEGKITEIGVGFGIPLLLGGPSLIRAGKIAKTEGLGIAVGELAFDFAPIKPTKRLFVPDVTTEPFKIDSLFIDTIGGAPTTGTQILVGKSRFIPSFEIRGVGISGKIPSGEELTAGFAAVKTPFFEIGRGGKIKTGFFEEVSPFVSRPISSEFQTMGIVGKIGKFDVGFPLKTRVIETKFALGTEKSFVGTKKIGEIEIGGVKIEESFVGIGKDVGIRKDVIGEGFLADFTGRGKRITFKKPPGEVSEVSGFTKIKSPKTKLIKIEAPQVSETQFIGGVVGTLPQFKIKADTLTKSVIPPILGGAWKGAGQFAGTGLYEKTDFVRTGSLGGLKMDTQQIRLDRDFTSGGLKMDTQQIGLDRDFTSFGFRQVTKQVIGQFPRQKPIFGDFIGERMEFKLRIAQKLQTSSRTRQEFKFEFPMRGFDFGIPRPRGGFRGFGFLGFFPPFGIADGLGKRRKPKRKFKRRPSLAAVVLDIRELKPRKGEITGIQLRPILSRYKAFDNKGISIKPIPL